MRYIASHFVKKLDVTDVKKAQKFEGFDLALGLLNNVSAFRHFCFLVERNSMDSSYKLWNKF